MSTDDDVNFKRVKDDSNLPQYLLGIIQIYSDKSATTLKSNDLVAYPVHAVFLTSRRSSGFIS